MKATTCKICGSSSEEFGTAEIMRKYQVQYFRCPACGFIQTEEPYWLEEAYSSPINVSDTGIISRNSRNTRIVAAFLAVCFDPHAKYVDYGGGYGVLVRMMRDKGFDFYRDDKYCENLFANGFDVADSGTDRFELLTAFELFEHFVAPCEELQGLLQKSDTILFTTEPLPDDPPHPSKWWYFGLDHGQHISFYTRTSLQLLGKSYGLHYHSCGNLHLFCRVKPLALGIRLQFACRPFMAWLLETLLRKTTLRDSDCRKIVAGT